VLSPFLESWVGNFSPAIVEIRDIRLGQLLRRWNGHNEPIQELKYSPDGLMVAIGREDGVQVWHLETNATFDVSCSPGSNINFLSPLELFGASLNHIHVWRITKPAVQQVHSSLLESDSSTWHIQRSSVGSWYLGVAIWQRNPIPIYKVKFYDKKSCEFGFQIICGHSSYRPVYGQNTPLNKSLTNSRGRLCTKRGRICCPYRKRRHCLWYLNISLRLLIDL
jgi:WD40 repeat protein